MGGHRFTVIALSLILVGACGQRRPVTLDGAIDDGLLAADKGGDAPLAPDNGTEDQSIVPDAGNPSSPKWKWAVAAGGTFWDEGYSIDVDTAGNSSVTGRFLHTASFGSTTLTSKGSEDIFVAKLDSTSKFLWAVSAGGTGGDQGYSIAVDGSGNSYVTGHFYGTATFGTTTLTSKGKTDIFVAKLDNGGKFLWAVSAGGTSHDYGTSIDVDTAGNSHVTGYFYGTATFGSTTLTSKGSADSFVAKLDSTGKFVWAVSAGGGT